MKKQRLVNVSPWLFAAASALLIIIISVFAVNNYTREKQLMYEALVREGQDTLRLVVSSTRASMRMNHLNIRMTGWNWTDHVQIAIESAKEQKDAKFLGLVDSDGVILASDNQASIGSTIDSKTFTYFGRIFENGKTRLAYRTHTPKTNGDTLFQIAMSFQLVGNKNIFLKTGPPVDPPRYYKKRRKNFGGLGWLRRNRVPEDSLEKDYFLVAELDLGGFNTALKRQLIQILTLSLVLLLVGVGGWLSLLTLQGLKGTRSRLIRIRKFTDDLVSSLPVGLIATDEEGVIRLINTSAVEMIGINQDEAFGQNPTSILPLSLSAEFENYDQIKEPHEVSFGTGKNPGSLLVMSFPLYDSDEKVVGKTMLLQDVSDIKQLQLELRRNERLAALGKMAAGVAHELRNPLSSIKGLAVLLRTKLQDDERGIETANILVKEVERLNRSIGELLEYAKPDKLNYELNFFSDVIKRSLAIMSQDLESAKIELTVSLHDIPAIRMDKDKINQVILNLIINAVQAIKNDGRIKIRLFCEKNEAICEIRDNGKGVKKKNIHRVFDPYFTTKQDGTGLGLAMSAKIIEAHSGRIEFQSSYNVGSSVRVILPIQEVGISGGSD